MIYTKCPAVTDHQAWIQAETRGAKTAENALHVLVFCSECNAWYLIVNGGSMHGTVSFRMLPKRMIPLPTETEQMVDDVMGELYPIYRPY